MTSDVDRAVRSILDSLANNTWADLVAYDPWIGTKDKQWRALDKRRRVAARLAEVQRRTTTTADFAVAK